MTGAAKIVEPGVFRLPARRLGVASAIGALACLAALVVVASVNDADALSTVALALAVLAFAIQIIVFIAEANAARAQMLRSEEINSDTRALLVDLRSTALSTQGMVGDQFGQLLGAFMDAAKATAREGGGKLDPDELERKMMANVRREFGTRATAPGGAALTSAESPLDRARRLRERQASERAAREQREATDTALQDMLSFPNAEAGQAAWQKIKELSPEARTSLRALAEDELVSRRSGNYVGLATSFLDEVGEYRSLLDAGLVELSRHEDVVIARLTDAGRDVARIFTAQGAIPGWIDASALVALLDETEERE